MVHLHVIAVAVATVGLVTEQQLRVFGLQYVRELSRRVIETGSCKPHPPGRIVVEDRPVAAVGVAEAFHPTCSENSGTTTQFIESRRVELVAHPPIGGRYDDHAMPRSRRPRQCPTRQHRFIVWMGVKGDDGGHGRNYAATIPGKNEWATSHTVATVRVVVRDAIAFSQQWVQAWNAHDIEAVLQHFHEDVVFTSPVAAALLPESAGAVRGKPALRAYWNLAVQRAPDLRFAVEGVYEGIDTIVITYRNQNGALVNEVLTFDGDLVVEGHGTYRAAVPGRRS